MSDGSVHPLIPNSAPETRAEMLRVVGVAEASDLYASIPEELLFRGPLDLPEPFVAEQDLRRHVEGLLADDVSSADVLSFLGGGCWRHAVPAVCDEIARRSEFLTAYGGSAYANRGVFQAQFEYQSLVGALVGMDLIGAPTYDWGTAAASALLMASTVTGRRAVVVPRTMGPWRRSQVDATCGAVLEVRTVGYDERTGALDLAELRGVIRGGDAAAVYVEVPAYLGFLEPRIEEIAAATHESGALFVVGVDPSSLGVLAAPADYGADVACGELQPLGVRMHQGGGLAGFLAARDEERFRRAYPTLLVSGLPTVADGELGYDWVNFDTVSYGLRERSTDFTGTTQVLWSIVAAVYLSLAGPEGMRELGEGVLQRSAYLGERLSRIPGVRGSRFDSLPFKELVVDLTETGARATDVLAHLRERGIFAGVDLTRDFPELGECFLCCVTEVHTKEDVDRLAEALAAVLEG